MAADWPGIPDIDTTPQSAADGTHWPIPFIHLAGLVAGQTLVEQSLIDNTHVRSYGHRTGRAVGHFGITAHLMEVIFRTVPKPVFDSTATESSRPNGWQDPSAQICGKSDGHETIAGHPEGDDAQLPSAQRKGVPLLHTGMDDEGAALHTLEGSNGSGTAVSKGATHAPEPEHLTGFGSPFATSLQDISQPVAV